MICFIPFSKDNTDALQLFCEGVNHSPKPIETGNNHLLIKENLKKELSQQNTQGYFFSIEGEKIGGGILNIRNTKKYNSLHISRIWVSPDYRRKGIATQFIKFSINQATILNCQNVSLDVHRSNTPAYTLYSRLGFYIFSIFANQPGESASYLMIKPLGNNLSISIFKIHLNFLKKFLIFILLFNMHSQPTLIHKLLLLYHE